MITDANFTLNCSYALALDECDIAALPGTAFGARAGDLSLCLSTSYLSARDDARAEAVLAAYTETPGTVEFVRSACPDVLEVGRRRSRQIQS